MILSNQVRCLKCGDTPFSAHRHDYRPCSCGAIAVDGGMEYLRRVGALDAYEDMSIELPDAACSAAMAIIEDGSVHGHQASYVAAHAISALVNNGVTLSREDTGMAEHVLMMQAARDGAAWGIENGRNALGILCAIVRNVRDTGGHWSVHA